MRALLVTCLCAWLAAPCVAQVPTAGTLGDVLRRRQAEQEQERQREEQARRQPVVKELKDDKARAYVGEIVQRILRQTDIKDQEKVQHEILEWDIVNAFVTPDLKVYVTTGLLELVESDDELACVIGHELGHLAGKHIHGRSKQAMLWQALMGIAIALSRDRGAVMGSQLLGTLGMMRYGRGQELEADRLGMKFAESAGYDPSQIMRFMQKMGEKDGKMDDPVTVFLSTHPPAPHRVDQAKKILKAEGIKESKVRKLSFNIRTDRSPVDFSTGIEGSKVTTAATNLLANGKLEGAEDRLPGWRVDPLGAVTTIKGGGVLLSGAFGSTATLSADPAELAPDTAYLMRARYHAVSDADLALRARFLDARGNDVGVVSSAARVKKKEDGRLGLDLGGGGRPVPAGAVRVVAELAVAPGPGVAVELRDVKLEKAAAKLPASATAMAGNLCPNPGFEDAKDGLPLHWKVTKGKGELDTKIKGEGARSLKLTAASTKEWAEAKSDRVKISRGVDYILSGQLRSSLGNQRMSLGLEFYRADGTTISQVLCGAQGVFPPAEFTKYHGILFAAGGRVTAPAGAVEAAVVALTGYYSTQPCWLDDIALIRVQSGAR